MLASRLNYYTLPYVAWGPNPQAIAVDVFTLNWDFPLIYAFPPFNLDYSAGFAQNTKGPDRSDSSGSVKDSTAMVLPTSQDVIDKPMLLQKDESILYRPFHQNESGPLKASLKLMACRLSGHPSRIEGYYNQLRSSYSTPGERNSETISNILEEMANFCL